MPLHHTTPTPPQPHAPRPTPPQHHPSPLPPIPVQDKEGKTWEEGYGICVWSAGNATRPLTRKLVESIPEQVPGEYAGWQKARMHGTQGACARTGVGKKMEY